MQIYVNINTAPRKKYFISNLVLLCNYKLTEVKCEATIVIYDSTIVMNNTIHKFSKDVRILMFSDGKLFLKELLNLHEENLL